VAKPKADTHNAPGVASGFLPEIEDEDEHEHDERGILPG
jgi:hypothetical protein